MFISIVRYASHLVAAFSLLAGAYSARADVVVSNFSDIKYWVGSGSNQAAFVIDWNDGTTVDNYTWGYRWDGAATGEDMLCAIDFADVRLTIGLQFFAGLGYSFSSGSYDADGNGSVDHSWDDTVDNGFWSYWTQETSSPFTSGTWTSSSVGITSRSLANGSWDGWSWAAGPTYTEPGDNGPDAGVAAVPEPESWLLAAAAMIFILGSRFRPTS